MSDTKQQRNPRYQGTQATIAYQVRDRGRDEKLLDPHRQSPGHTRDGKGFNIQLNRCRSTAGSRSARPEQRKRNQPGGQQCPPIT